jgi:hypothetical protein
METRGTNFHSEENMSIVQLATSGQDSFDYVACGKAITDKLIEVKELSESGSVNTIFVLNNSDQFVFMMDGDILAGAKQNRVVNVSILLAPRSKTQIPVSCVEQGRWKHTSAAFRGTDYAAPTFLRAGKADQVRESLKKKRGFASDQGDIWGSVADYQRLHQVDSKTSNLSDIFEEKADEFTQLIARFAADKNANGFAVFFGKTLASIDIFNRRKVYQEYFPKLLRGAAFEASTVKPAKEALTEAEARYRSLEFLDAVEQQHFDEQNGVGVGLDRRFKSLDSMGFQLVYHSHLIHLAAFSRSGGQRA